jgi:hypothetical protein
MKRVRSHRPSKLGIEVSGTELALDQVKIVYYLRKFKMVLRRSKDRNWL